MREFTIGKNEAGQRFDKYLFKLLKNAGGGLLYKQLRNKNITLNGHKAKGSEILSENDTVKVFMADDTIDKFMGETVIRKTDTGFRLSVIYEDDNVIICDKPQGILSQKAKPDDLSMNEYLIEYMLQNGLSRDSLSTFKPAFVNRLDTNTSGLVIAGKSLAGLQEMSRLIRERLVEKYYLAIVCGRMTESTTLKGYLIKDEKSNTVTIHDEPTKDAVFIHTGYEVLRAGDDFSLLKVHLITGKTHQIRAHLAHLGHPILGDGKYGDAGLNRKYHEKYQLLHSFELIFPKLSGDFAVLSEKVITSPYPKRFAKYFLPEDING